MNSDILHIGKKLAFKYFVDYVQIRKQENYSFLLKGLKQKLRYNGKDFENVLKLFIYIDKT